jgi:leucyl/phenylalanyl-tRNA--protein transferase
MRQSERRYRVAVDTRFGDVIRACASPTREGVWITPQFIDAYEELHRLGWAHSVETYNADGLLVGGLYGVRIGRLFAGESMFHLQRDASKVALMHLVALMEASAMTLLDVQWSTPHLASLGVIEVPRASYLGLLAAAVGNS